MNTNMIYSRQQQKIDTEANWLKAVNFTPLKGEIIIYSKDENCDHDRIKIGDGVTKVNDLPFYGESNKQINLTGELVELNVNAETPLSVVSVFNRDTTWGLSNTLVLHQVSGNNFVDFSAWLGGVGKVFEKNGLKAIINNNSTITITGTNESTSTTGIIDRYNWDDSRIYPAGTYIIPNGFTMATRSAQYPSNVAIPGVSNNLTGIVTIPEPFRIIWLRYGVEAGRTIDLTLPLGLFYGNTVPETGFEYIGNIYTVTFDSPVYEGEFNWKTGELKDVDGNIIAYYDTHEIKSLPNTNYFWTGFGENTISNKKDEGKVIIRLNEIAPEETIPSICDFMFVPTTSEATYGLSRDYFLPGGKFYGKEVPLLTTKGTLSVQDIDGNIKYSKYIDPMINSRGVSDKLTHKGLEKQWSKKFYLNKEPISITIDPPGWTGPLDAYIIVWEFDENDFINTGIPAKIHDIPMASPCFINNNNSENDVLNQELWNGSSYPAFFTYDSEAEKYILTVRGTHASTIDAVKAQISMYSKVYFYYQLEASYDMPFTFAMGIEAGDQILFDLDLVDNQPYIDSLDAFKNQDINPAVTVFVPRSIEDALDGMNNTAIILNTDKSTGGDATVQGYSWIGAGDGTTDYTLQIQSKLDELHNISDGGTIHLGPGTYPISKSLIVYNNTQIIGNGHTIIKQTADNTHAIIWNGSNIRMSDLTIKLAGACTELTACIYANSNNIASGNRDEKYPENSYVQYCSINNVVMIGTYELSWEGEYQILPDEVLAYRGVGVYSKSLYFNFFNCDGLTCRNLYAGVYNGGGANNYNIYVTDSRFAVWGGGANNIFDIIGHTYYAYGRDGRINATEYAYYGHDSEANEIKICFYDLQYSTGLIYFDGTCQRNKYSIAPDASGTSTTMHGGDLGDYKKIRDYGRANNEVQPFRERFVGIGSALYGINGLPYWNTQFNPGINNALSGAGRWGTITSNKEWTSNEIELSDICRYPKDTLKTFFGLASTVCSVSPSEESPIEIIIDISDRPVTNYESFWIQFDHNYVAEKYTVSFDTTNDGTFNKVIINETNNEDVISYRLNYQEPSLMVYRIKISITKALQIQDFQYKDSSYNDHTINYNPDGLIGIVNIGMPSNEAYGRAFLGECGGNVYGNLLLNKNSTIKNVPTPVDNDDIVSKKYVDEKISNTSKQMDVVIEGTGIAVIPDAIKDFAITVSSTESAGASVIVSGRNLLSYPYTFEGIQSDTSTVTNNLDGTYTISNPDGRWLTIRDNLDGSFTLIDGEDINYLQIGLNTIQGLFTQDFYPSTDDREEDGLYISRCLSYNSNTGVIYFVAMNCDIGETIYPFVGLASEDTTWCSPIEVTIQDIPFTIQSPSNFLVVRAAFDLPISFEVEYTKNINKLLNIEPTDDPKKQIALIGNIPSTEHLASKSYVAENTLKEIKTGVGLNVSEKENNSQQIDIDENIIFVFDCGGADITNYEPITTVTNDAGGNTAII